MSRQAPARLATTRHRRSSAKALKDSRLRLYNPGSVRRVLMTAVLACAMAVPAAAQGPDPKRAFTEALGRFSLALDGAFGDEGPTLGARLDALAQSGQHWDALIQGYERAIAADLARADPATAANLHTAIGGIYLDRGRFDDAQRSFEAALALDSTRADALLLVATARASTPGAAGAAADAFSRAWVADRASSIRAYLVARWSWLAGQGTRAQQALARLLADTTAPKTDGASPPSFLQVGLVGERPGIEPYFPLALYDAGFDRLRHGSFDEAVAAFRTAMALDPLAATAGLEAGSLKRAGEAFRGGFVDEAVTALRTAIELAPDRSEPRRVLGMVYLADGQAERAIESFRTAVRLRGDDERARLGLADALIAAGRVDDAIAELRTLISRVPRSGRARYALGLAHQRQANYPAALEAFDAAVPFAPLLGLNSLLQTIGALRRQQQDFDGAIAAFSRRVDLVPNEAAAHHELADMYFRRSRHEEALAEYAAALLLDPTRAAARVAIGQIHLRDDRFADAAAAARLALTVDPNQKEARYVLGTALMRLGEAEAGRAELAAYQQLQRDASAAQARAFELAGLRREATVHAAKGDHASAASVLQRLLDLDPSSPQTKADLGIALLRAGRPQDAIAPLNAAVEAGAPLDTRKTLAEAYVKAGQPEAASAQMAEYERLRREALRSAGADR